MIIAGSTLDSNAIPTAMPMFSGSAIPMGHAIYTLRLNWEETGSGKSKMAAYTHVYLRYQTKTILIPG